eukprot:g4347.t1
MFYLPLPCLLNRKRRNLLRPEATTSAIELNQEGLAEPFTLSDRIADNMTIFVLAVIFSPGFPILLPLSAAAIIATYWTEKWLFLRYYSIEIEYSLDILVHFTTRYIPVSVALHCVGALMMFGNYQIFLDMGTASDASDILPCETDSSTGRTWCEYDPSYNLNEGKSVLLVPIIALGIFVGGSWILHELNVFLFESCCGEAENLRLAREKMSYATYAKNAPETDVVTYNMLANPKYQEILEVTDKIWKVEGKKHLHQVKNYIPLKGEDVKALYKYTIDIREATCCSSGKTFTPEWIATNERQYFSGGWCPG